MYCGSCGKPTPDDSRFCEFCGSPMQEKSADADELNDRSDAAEQRAYDGEQNARQKPRARIKILPILLVAAIAVGGIMAVNSLKGEEGILEISDIPSMIRGKTVSEKDITEDDFSWYVPASYDEVPKGGKTLPYKDILGVWKVMAVNHVSEPEETFFSTVTIKENSSAAEKGKNLNTAVEFTHHFVEFNGEKSALKGDEAKDLLYANYEDEVLIMALGDDRLAEIIFWENNKKQYGQSHVYADWDNDGIGDLVNVLLFIR